MAGDPGGLTGDVHRSFLTAIEALELAKEQSGTSVWGGKGPNDFSNNKHTEHIYMNMVASMRRDYTVSVKLCCTVFV